ncbi:hypothetical protein [Streptomyces albidoflavus]|uniref:hypothetical protein n=1 Tax=Streptomyces albidoflavus TaxID=1886 RepID=UPI00340F453B
MKITRVLAGAMLAITAAVAAPAALAAADTPTPSRAVVAEPEWGRALVPAPVAEGEPEWGTLPVETPVDTTNEPEWG